MFLFLNNGQGVGIVLVGHIQFRLDCFQREYHLNMQLQKHHNLSFNDTTTTRSISSEDQHKGLIRRRSHVWKNGLRTPFQLK